MSGKPEPTGDSTPDSDVLARLDGSSPGPGEVEGDGDTGPDAGTVAGTMLPDSTAPRRAPVKRGNLKPVEQLAFDERIVEDKELEAALEKHLRAKDDRAEINLRVKNARATVDGELARHPLEVDETIRVGRFRITKSRKGGGHVEFDTAPSESIRIGLVESK